MKRRIRIYRVCTGEVLSSDEKANCINHRLETQVLNTPLKRGNSRSTGFCIVFEVSQGAQVRIDQPCFNGDQSFRLLGIETQVFEIGSGNSIFCTNEIASGAVQPFPGVVGREAFRRLHI